MRRLLLPWLRQSSCAIAKHAGNEPLRADDDRLPLIVTGSSR
jgi:hypothetical protein